MSSLRRRTAPEPETPVLPGLVDPDPVRLPARPASEPGGAVQVIAGPTAESLELAGMSVGEAYGLLRVPFNLAPMVTALVNGRPVEADHRLALGDVLEFTRPAGEKGAG
jgi:hypothetical protein